jgi:hypothetical protein
MVKTPLVEELKPAGQQLLQMLDPHLDIRAAFWIFREEFNSWRLIIASPLVDEVGAPAVYMKIHPFWTKIDEFEGSEITVTGLNDPLVRLVSKAVGKREGTKGKRFGPHVVDGTYIEDSYIYRMNV